MASQLRIQSTEFADGLQINDFVVEHFRSNGMSNQKYELTVPGIKFKPYEFLIALVNPTQSNLVALSQQFEFSVWCILIFVCMFISRILNKVNIFSVTHYHVGHLDWTFLTLSAFFGQCNDSIRFIFKTDKCKLLWILWTFSSFIISSMYDGQSYFLLSGEYNAKYPTNLDEVADQNLSVLTTGVSFRSYNSTYRVASSVLKDYIMTMNRTNPSLVPKYFEILLKNMHFVHNREQLWSSNVDEIIRFTKHCRKNMFVKLDEPKRLKEITPSIEMAKGIKIVSKKSVSNFVRYTALLVRRNFLHSRILHILWQSKESGLWDYWDKINYLDSQIDIFAKQREIDQNRSINVVGYLNKYLSNDFDTTNEGLKDTPIALSFNLLLNVFCMVLMLSAFGVFCIEKRRTMIAVVDILTKYYKSRKLASKIIQVKSLPSK